MPGTLYCFLHQILNQCSFKAALAHLDIQRRRLNLKMVSMSTAAYTNSKKRLSESKIWNALKKRAEKLNKAARFGSGEDEMCFWLIER